MPTVDHLRIVKDLWNLRSDLRFIRKVENWIYSSDLDGVFVRLTDPKHRILGQIAAELDWMDHLKATGVSLANPTRSQRGNYSESIEFNGEVFFAVVFETAPGRELSNPKDFTPGRLEEWGRVIGRLHSATKTYSRPATVQPRPQWDGERNYLAIGNHISSVDGELFERFRDIDGWLKTLSKGVDEYGLVHADIHHGNFRIDDHSRLTLFDFDDCHYHWYSYDLAVPIFLLTLSLARKPAEIGLQPLLDAFWTGYASTNSLSKLCQDSVTRFIEYRGFVMYCWCVANLHNTDLDERSKNWMISTMSYCKQDVFLLR